MPTPVPTATAAPTATPTPTASPTPTATPVKNPEDEASGELKKHCARHYPGLIQGELRAACHSAGEEFKATEKTLASTRCRLSHGEEPRLVMACLIGVNILHDMANSKEDFKKKLQVCAEQYPQHTEIDAFLQESCLTGVHLPDTMRSTEGPGFAACGKLSPERSFIGPCAVGLSLARESLNSSEPGQQNKFCEQYFDHRRLHQTYRACLNARSVPIEADGTKVEDVLASCANIVSDPDNDNERAACLIGTGIHRALTKKDEISKKFQKCGDNKVSYQNRDVLACLAAATLLEFGDKSRADAGCKNVFKQNRNSSRNSCASAIGLF